MIEINIREGFGLEVRKFPDGQYHVELHNNVKEGSDVHIKCSIRNPVDLYILMATVNAVRGAFATPKKLTIEYLMGARSDRHMQWGDSVDLKVVADMINMCGFSKVLIQDVHSDVALQLINNSINISNESLVRMYDKEDAVLICPDAGAAKKIDNYFGWNKNITDIVHCTKNRDLKTGKIDLTVLNPDVCHDRHCVIIDDLCDGGGTFLAIESQLPRQKSLTLIVTHGIFSKGLAVFNGKFDHIITTNSYQKQVKTSILTTKEILDEH